MRGVSFEIPNAYGKYLFEILANIHITEFFWRIGGGEAYYVEANQFGPSLFPSVDIIDGTTLYNTILKQDYYLIFADLKAFTEKEDVKEIETYEAFVNSECQFVLLVVDSCLVYIYAKNQWMIMQLHDNAVAANYKEIHFLTDEDDPLTTFIAF